MTFSVCFIERKVADTQSLEKVFRTVARELEKNGISAKFQKLPAGNGFFGIIWNLIFFRPAPADIYHITGHVHFIGLKLDPKKTILTIHDLWILHNRTGIRRWILKKLLFDWPLGRLRWVTAISEATKRELLESTDVVPESIHVVYNPVEIHEHVPAQSINNDKPVILQVGTSKHKNLETVAKALSGLDCKLRVIGRLSEDQRRLLRKNDIDYENDISLNESQMDDAYRSSDILVFCSTFEGFGLPVVEAQSAGLPVITSDRDPMREVGGKAAMLADPDDPVSIRLAVEQLIADRGHRSQIIELGRINVNRFTPEVIADQYITIYERMLFLKKSGD